MQKYEDDKFVTLTNEFEQIQSCIGMYISSGGTAGAIHLFKELFNNALDEVNNDKSPADTIWVSFDKATQQITVTDNGRGIPFDVMESVCTKKHSGSKIGKLHSKKSAGCNGVGITVTIAFSKDFAMESHRGKEYRRIEFHDCKMVDCGIKKTKEEMYGTMVSFIPSHQYLGDFQITDDDLMTWFRHMSYIIDPGVSIKYTSIGDNGKDAEFTREFTSSTLADNVRYFSSTLEFDPITIKYESDNLDVSFAFSYDKTLSDEIVESYSNFVITVDGGYHEMAAKRALIDFFVKAARNADPDSKYEVTQDDCRKGLIMAVNCNYTNVILGGQTKSKVENKEIVTDAKPSLVNGLKEYFNTNNSQLNKIIAYLRQMARIRLEAYKIKGVKPPKVMSVFDEAGIKDYFGVSDRNSKGYKELIITEGDSASGAVRNVRNPKYQAVYTTQGVMTNCAEKSFAEIAKSRVPHDLAEILGVEIGPNADITNLRFNKIICLQDADADGYNIRSLVCTYLIVAMPQLIVEGRLYTGVPPLYTLSEKTTKKYKSKIKKDFLFDKHEYQTLINDIIADNVKMCIEREDGVDEMNKGELKAWLVLNRQYLTLLDYLTKKTAIHPDILEYVCDALLLYDTTQLEFSDMLGEKLPEMTFDITTKSLSGSYKSEDYYLIIDDLFKEIASEFMHLLDQNASLTVAYKNKNDPDDEWTHSTIGCALREIYNSYDLDVNQRFKGLGEVKSALLFYSTLNPKVRKLVRLTMEDREKVLEDVKLLRGKKEVEGRRELLLGKDVDDDDIDN